MSVQYRIDVRNTSGVLQAMITDPMPFTYRKAVNEVGLLTFALPADHGAISYLSDKAQLEVWRRDTTYGVAWYCDYYGLVRTTQYAYDQAGRETFTIWCPSILTMLGWRIVAWAAGTDGRSAFTADKAETISKNLVTYNAAASATVANGRIREGAITGLSVQADAAGGNTLDWNCAYKGLLATLQDLAKVGGGDFDLVCTAPATYEFRWYSGQLGTDRSASVAFTVARGNMAEPVLTDARADEKTVCIVGGKGEQSSRVTVVRTGAAYNASSNNVEVFADARNAATTEALNAKGDTVLDDAETRQTLSFRVVETPSCVYGTHFGLGDLVTASYRTFSETVKVRAVTVSMDERGAESKTFEMATV